MAAGRLVARNGPERGLLAIASGAGNNGFTMGGFIIYLLFQERGYALVSVYGLAWTFSTVLLFYPIARHYTSHGPPAPLGRLMLHSLFDWRSIALPITLAGVALGYSRVPQPTWISQWHIVDALIFTITPLAYFGIGLRAHVRDLLPTRHLLSAVAAMRFVVALGVGVLLVTAVNQSPWPLSPLAAKVFLIEAFVPTAVTMVAVANMFDLLPRQASTLFLVNTLTYLLIVLPGVLWFFGR
jgi:predicted permease